MIYTLIHEREPIPCRTTYIEYRSQVKIFINFLRNTTQFHWFSLQNSCFFIVLRHQSWGVPFGEPEKLIFFDTILTQLCNPTAYLNFPPTSLFRPCAKIRFFQYPENFSGPTLKFRTWPFWGINGNGNHWVQTCETNIWRIFKPLALIHANKSTPSPNSWQGRIRI